MLDDTCPNVGRGSFLGWGGQRWSGTPRSVCYENFLKRGGNLLVKREKTVASMNTPEDEEKLLQIKSALVSSALGAVEQKETFLSKSKNGKPIARQKLTKSKPDPKAALAYARLLAAEKAGASHKNKFLQVTEDERILLSTSKIADIMHVSVKTIGVWERQGCPKEKRGWYDIAAVIKWRGREIGVQGGADGMAAKLEADTRLKLAKAAMAETELRQKNGELIPLSVVEERLGELFSEIRTSFLSIGDHIMAETYTQYPELAPQARRMIDVYIREALKSIADTGSFRYIARQSVKKTAGRPRKRN